MQTYETLENHGSKELSLNELGFWTLVVNKQHLQETKGLFLVANGDRLTTESTDKTLEIDPIKKDPEPSFGSISSSEAKQGETNTDNVPKRS